MSRQAQVGLFTVLGFLLAAGVFYVLADIGTRSRGYRIFVDFQSASGLHNAAIVYLSGVGIGAVDDISLLPDYTSRVTIAVKPNYAIPTGSRFIIQAPITGEPSILITPPKNLPANAPTIAANQEVRGVNPVSFADLLEQGQGEVRRLDDILAQLEASTPNLLSELQATLKNAHQLTTTANSAIQSLSSGTQTFEERLSGSLTTAGGNVAALTATLDSTVKRNSGQVDILLSQLNRTAKSFGETVDSLHDVATNPTVKSNLLETTKSFALTAKTLALLAEDLRQVTGNPQTQAELRDTVANVDATSQKVDSLLKSLGGTSSVYGVDRGATPAPGGLTPPPPGFVPTSMPAIPPSPAPGLPQPGAPSSGASGAPPPAALEKLRQRLNQFTSDLVQLQVRVSQLSPERPGSADRNTSPLLSADRGPMSDFNLTILPHAGTSIFTGVNDVGAYTTGNLMLIKNEGQLKLGGGIEYSRLGGVFSWSGNKLGFESRFYDLRHPTLDQYFNYFAGRKFQIFGGERDLNHTDRRTVFGLQTEL
jgi:ABC-type transporter Mla subunit MlaD